jgi:hypothetical protein
VAALLLILAASVPAVMWVEREADGLELHGPIGIAGAIPFVIVFAIGSLFLGGFVAKTPLPLGTKIAGLAPACLTILGLIAIVIAAL